VRRFQLLRQLFGAKPVSAPNRARTPPARQRQNAKSLVALAPDSRIEASSTRTTDRGNDKLNLHYHYLDLVPKGRDEGGRGPYWVRRHDEYGR
jgi:predicted dithiol-disulfide oxidoreductase (DUF899 family)